jgi:DNA-binding LacI/PurR family transcriptional regulator
MRKIARELGISTATVSRSLRGDSRVRPEKRDWIVQEVERRGYVANSYLGKVMSSVRKGEAHSFRGTLGLLWTGCEPRSDARLRDMRAGVLERAGESDFAVDEFTVSRLAPGQLSTIVHNRGIEGLLIVAPALQGELTTLNMDLENLSCVSLGAALTSPSLHRIRFDYFEGVRLALAEATRQVCGPVAALWNDETDEVARRAARAAFITHHSEGLETADRLFLTPASLRSRETRSFLKKSGVKGLIIESSMDCPDWLEALVPPQRQVLFRRPANRPCLGWIDTQNRLLGSWGLDFLAAKIHQRERGVPALRQELLVPPIWNSGALVRGSRKA